MNRVGDVLDRLHAAIVERGCHPVLDGAADGLGDDDSARLGERLQTGGDVDAVAIHVAVRPFDHVAQMDADAKAQAEIVRNRLRRRIEGSLHGERGIDGAGGGIENREHRVAGHVDDMTLIGLDLRSENALCGLQRRGRRALVRLHQARISDGVRCQNRRQALLQAAFIHVSRPLPGESCQQMVRPGSAVGAGTDG